MVPSFNQGSDLRKKQDPDLTFEKKKPGSGSDLQEKPDKNAFQSNKALSGRILNDPKERVIIWTRGGLYGPEFQPEIRPSKKPGFRSDLREKKSGSGSELREKSRIGAIYFFLQN